MKVINKYRLLTALILIISLFFTSFSSIVNATEMDSYVLEHSEVINSAGIWGTDSDIVNEHLLRYNCYAYAINRVEFNTFYKLYYNMDIGTRLQYQPGNMCRESYSVSDGMDVYDLAMLIKEDLVNLGYDSNSIFVSFSTPNTSNWNPNMELICVRTGYHYDNTYPIPFDYHFMKYDISTNAWYHKVGGSAIMRYNYTPWQENHVWVGEMYDNGDSKLSGYTYTSSIVYIMYPKLQLDTSYGKIDKEIVLKSDRDIIYEILVPETGIYSFEISSDCQEANYAYEIYSYNMYNGDYQIIEFGIGNSSIESNESINLITPNDFNDPYQAKKYYIRLYFDRSISEDSSINVSIEHPHSYNYNYDNESNTKHKSYCECGEYILQDHNYVDYEKISDEYHTEICNCGYEHENQAHFEHRYGYTLFDTQNHNIYCICGHLIKTEKHNLRFLNGGSYCTLCGYEKKTGLDIMGKKEENMIM